MCVFLKSPSRGSQRGTPGIQDLDSFKLKLYCIFEGLFSREVVFLLEEGNGLGMGDSSKRSGRNL